MKKHLFTGTMAALLCVSVLFGGVSALAVAADPNPPVAGQKTQNAAPAAQNAATGEPSGEATAEPLPIVAGTYEGSDGSELEVEEDGSCEYETLVSGTVNGKAMSARLTFHGTLEEDGFSFTKVTFYGLDLTAIAASVGYTDAAYWETAAGIIYEDALSR